LICLLKLSVKYSNWAIGAITILTAHSIATDANRVQFPWTRAWRPGTAHARLRLATLCCAAPGTLAAPKQNSPTPIITIG